MKREKIFKDAPNPLSYTLELSEAVSYFFPKNNRITSKAVNSTLFLENEKVYYYGIFKDIPWNEFTPQYIFDYCKNF